MILGRKSGGQRTQRIRDVVEEVLTDALQRQGQELALRQTEQTNLFGEMMEKNQKAVRRLSDTVEDFLDTLQEEDEEQRQLRQSQKASEEREHRLVELLGLYQAQMELFEQWITGQDQESSEEMLEAWKQQYAMLKEKIRTESRFCAIEDSGAVGEPVDYRLHEVLQAVEPDTKEQEGTIANVYSHGMLYQGNVIRKARVAAYRKG